MKKYIILKMAKIASIIVAISLFGSCMDNDPKYLPKDMNFLTLLTQMQDLVVPTQENQYQHAYGLLSDVYGHYLPTANSAWNGGNFAIYSAPSDWIDLTFEKPFSEYYGLWILIKNRYGKESMPYGMAQLYRVASMKRLTDTFGPIPYSMVATGDITIAYDSQEKVYTQFFDDIDTAILELMKVYNANPSDRAFADYDLVYGGDLAKWICFANSLKLRLAVRISYVNPTMARKKAEEAINHEIGVMMSNDDNAKCTTRQMNPVFTMAYRFDDNRVSADIVSFLVGYSDPRTSKYLTLPISHPTHAGLRIGATVNNDHKKNYSTPNVSESSPVLWMNAAEVAFLRAEGVLKGWDMGGTAQELYEKGVNLSLEEYGVGAEYATYIADNTKKPAAHVDPVGNGSISAVSTITIKWDEAATEQVKLERIITQKWIANFPLGCEAWADNLRTGYPRFIPTMGTTIPQASRIPFSPQEKIYNTKYYNDAVTLLGGPDNYTTKQWWDKNTNKP